MRIRLAAVAVALVVLVLVLAIRAGVRPAREAPPSDDAAATLARALNAAQARITDESPWTVIGASAAHGALVVDIHAGELDRLMDIAREIVEPVQDDFEEVLIYVHPPGSAGDAPVRRIQWTPGGGYVDSASPPPP